MSHSKLFGLWLVVLVIEALSFWTSAHGQEVAVGQWLKASPNARYIVPIPSNQGFGGWQTSDLTWDPHTGDWFSICDQNGGDGHRGKYVYRISLGDNGPIAKPLQVWWKNKAVFSEIDNTFRAYEDSKGQVARVGTGHIDFEGLTADPVEKGVFYACTEGPEPWLVKLQYEGDESEIYVTRSVRISRVGNHTEQGVDHNIRADGWSEFVNKRWEGLAITPDGKTLVLASEWTDSPSQLYTVEVADFEAETKVLPKPLKSPKFSGELTGLSFLTDDKGVKLLVLERNGPPSDSKRHPRIYILDFKSPETAAATIQLDLRAPALDGSPKGIRIQSASPEGIATNGQQLLLIGDPAGRFYQSETGETNVDKAKLENLIPLVFQIDLESVLAK